MDRGAWQAAVHEVTKRWAQLSNQHKYTQAKFLIVYLLKVAVNKIWRNCIRLTCSGIADGNDLTLCESDR